MSYESYFKLFKFAKRKQISFMFYKVQTLISYIIRMFSIKEIVQNSWAIRSSYDKMAKVQNMNKDLL